METLKMGLDGIERVVKKFTKPGEPLEQAIEDEEE
ncbi:hypothetical protein H4I95_01773 [Botrytis cinerea]